MGLFDFLKRDKKEPVPTTEAPKRYITDPSINQVKNDLYLQFKKDLEEVQKLCAEHNLDFDDLAQKSGLSGDWIPANAIEYDNNFADDFDFAIERFPNFVKRVKKEVELKQKQTLNPEPPAPPKTPSTEAPTMTPRSNSVMGDKIKNIKIVSDSEIGQAVDDYLDAGLKAFEDPRLGAYAADTLAEYKSHQLKTKKDEAFIYVLEQAKNDPEFIKNCSDYPRPYSYITVIAEELDRIYSKTKEEQFNPLSDFYKGILLSYCKKNALQRNIDIYTKLVKGQTNRNQKTHEHRGNFLNKYAEFVGREYQLGGDPTKIGQKYFEEYKKYYKYASKLSGLKDKCKKLKLKIEDIFTQHGVPFVETFEEYYDYENKEILLESLATITPIIERLIKERETKRLIEELSENPMFLKNAEIYGGSIEFIQHVTEQLLPIFEATQRSKFDPNNLNCLRVYCTLPEEERNALFEKVLTEAKNKGIKK